MKSMKSIQIFKFILLSFVEILKRFPFRQCLFIFLFFFFTATQPNKIFTITFKYSTRYIRIYCILVLNIHTFHFQCQMKEKVFFVIAFVVVLLGSFQFRSEKFLKLKERTESRRKTKIENIFLVYNRILFILIFTYKYK